MQYKNKYFISKGKRELWERILALIMYFSLLVIIISIFVPIPLNHFEHIYYISPKGKISIFTTILTMAVKFSLVKNYYFDLENSRYKAEYKILFFGFGKWKPISNVQYISVFLQHLVKSSPVFRLNLLYDTNKHITIYDYDNPDKITAFEDAYHIATTMKIDMLDATQDEFQWIDLTKDLSEILKERVG